MPEFNRQIVLAARPKGAPKNSDFRLVETPVPEPGVGELLCQTIYLSLDPYLRGSMNAAKSYAAPAETDAIAYAGPVEIGAVMGGGTVSRVLESRADRIAPGDFIVGLAGWQDYSIAPGDAVHTVHPQDAPISTALGVLGMPGMTAYTGLLNIGKPTPEETLVVAAASGAVGSVVGQIAKIKGCRVIGIAGGPEKCAFAVEVLGFDVCLDRHDPELASLLEAACPDGVDIYFENVGGSVFEAVWPLLNPFARVPVCGLISQYNAVTPQGAAMGIPEVMREILTKSINLRGFMYTDFLDQVDEFRREMGNWVSSGLVRYREHVVDGLENAPRAFQGLFKGENIGKLLVRVSPDPTL